MNHSPAVNDWIWLLFSGDEPSRYEIPQEYRYHPVETLNTETKRHQFDTLEFEDVPF